MGQVDATVVNVSLSSLAVDLHSSLSTIQWVTSGYLLALALMLPLNGWLVGQLGARSLYLGSAGAGDDHARHKGPTCCMEHKITPLSVPIRHMCSFAHATLGVTFRLISGCGMFSTKA